MPFRRNDPGRGERLQIMLSPEELAAVDDFRFLKRMPSRAAAVRELFRLGLANAGVSLPAGTRKSSEIGVLTGKTNGEGKATGADDAS
jgi:hypothetical protein